MPPKRRPALDLAAAEAFCQEMRASNKATDKKEVLGKHPEMKPLLRRVYDPYARYNVSSANIKRRTGAKRKTPGKSKKSTKSAKTSGRAAPQHLFQLLDLLQTREVTGNEALYMAREFADRHPPEVRELIYRVLDKDLKIGVQPKTINAVFPDLVPQFEVVLAEAFHKFSDKIDLEQDRWFASRKLDGCRCLAVVDAEGAVTFYSRAGNEFESLSVLSAALSALDQRSVVFDGEACIMDADGLENFTSCVSQIKRKNHTIEQPVYFIFDAIPLEEFTAGRGPTSFCDRQSYLKAALQDAPASLRLVEQISIDSAEELMAESDRAEANGWEGLILRKDVPYLAKRNKDTLKVKKFHDAEFEVKDTIMDRMQVVRDGQKVEIDTLSAVVIEHNGNEVRVGSGFSLEEREQIYNDPASIVGKEITVQYFEETENKKGGGSLRFPTVKQIWWEPRDI